MRARIIARVILAFSALAACTRGDVTVAAAANLGYTLEPLKAAFALERPDVKVITITGASGTLAAQIRAGAPYDIFLSADTEFPRALIAEKLASESSFTVFARGRLAFWSTQPWASALDLNAALTDVRMKKVALANPKTAPYGRAAKQVLERLGKWEPDSNRWVYGENISQTAQFIESGNAEGGFVALSLLRSPKLRDKAKYIIISDTWHESLDHAGVVTRRGESNPEATAFLRFLRSAAARAVWEEFGYSAPE